MRNAAHDHTEFVAEYRFQRADSRYAFVWDRSVVLRDGAGVPVRAVGILVDISERRAGEQALAEANERLEDSVRQLELHNREMQLLGELGEMLQSCVSDVEAHNVLAHLAPQLFLESDGALFITRPSRDILELVSSWGPAPLVDHFNPDDCWALRRGVAHVVLDVTNGLLCPHLHDAVSGGRLCLPLMVKGEAMGILHLSSAHSLSEATRLSRLGVTVGDQVSLALANLQLREKLRMQSIRDVLTGMYNRRHMEESLAREMSRADREHTHLAVLMLDVDHFKQFNDTNGHEAGDAMLRQVATYLLQNSRTDDVVCRYGGEEITIILPRTSLESALARAEQLRAGVAQLEGSAHGRPLGAVTISIGVAAYSAAGGSTADALVKAADDALYRAKQAGRNRVEAAPNPLGASAHASDDAA